ncbi:MAG: FAD synthetase family protein [Bacteroidales bacterium]|nr:FAD synthetase family protein [Bacteroidales bacterium]
MDIYTDINQLPYIKYGIVSVGTFDGVHEAHRIILAEMASFAHTSGGESIVFTFASHPQKLIDPQYDIKILTTQQEKNCLFEQMGVNHVVYLPFDWNIAKMSYIDFIDMLSSKIKIAGIVVGYDHGFGRNREGNIARLQQLADNYRFELVEIPKQTVNGMNIKSSVIRDVIKKGDMLSANRLLGYEYSIEVLVCGVEPHAAASNPEKLLPADGIYPVEIDCRKKTVEIKAGKFYLPDEDMLFAMRKKDTFVVKFIGNKTAVEPSHDVAF